MKLGIVSLIIIAILSGCVGLRDKYGWSSSQKKEFLEILEKDKYLSICNNKELYSRVKSSKDSQLMSMLLISYAKNLENSCIDIASFKASQRTKKAKNIDTGYEIYTQEINSSKIMANLKEGKTIEEILTPYIPPYKQFSLLLKEYHKEPSSKLRINIERLKIMRPNIKDTFVLVNIPEFMARVIEDNNTTLKMRVVVGKTNMQTPVFSTDMKYIMINPQWNVPDSIARKSIIPKMLRDSSYLKRKNMTIRKSYDLNSPEISQYSVNWSPYVGGKGYVPYKFIEKPSLKNGLGKVKFMFPNKYAVYMHDTQSKYLFKRDVRAYSHGCIRLSEPKKMLEHISKNYTSKSKKDIMQRYNSLKSSYLSLVKHLPVHTAYLTTYVENGKLLLFKDIYGYDKSQKIKE